MKVDNNNSETVAVPFLTSPANKSTDLSNHKAEDGNGSERTEIVNITHSFAAITTFQAIFMLFSAYLFASLVTFEWRRKTKCVKTLAKKIVSFTGARNYMASGKLLRYLCIAGSVFCFLTCLNDLIFYNLDYNTDFGCTAMQIIGVSLLIGLDTVVYIFLWIRQYVTCRRFLVRNRVLFIFLTIIKWSVLILIILLAAVMDCLLIICRRHYFDNTTKTCEQFEHPADSAITHLWTAGSVSLQVILVFLFAFPLLQQYAFNTPLKQSGKPEPIKTNGTAATSRGRIMALVQRCVIIASLCVITDIACMLVTEYKLDGSQYRQLRALLYDVNIIFNLVLIIRSFKDWKSMITFGKCFRKQQNMPASSNDMGL
ncbi:uncharacterized protein LOC120340789 [Styela clava]